MQEFLFDVIFTHPDGTEDIIGGWRSYNSMGYSYYEAELGDLRFCLQANRVDQWYLKVFNAGSEPISGFAGIRFPWKHRDSGFTLIPGIYYNGNLHEFQKNIPVIRLPESPLFAASFSAATFPAVLV